MIRFAFALIVAPALAFAQPHDPRSSTEPAPRGEYASTALEGARFELPFVRFVDGIMIENVMINGHGPFRFVLDTGAEGAGRLDRAVVDALQIPATGSTETLTPTGARAVSEHTIDTLTLGPLTFTGVQVLSRDYRADIPPGFKPFDGILGYHLFREYLLTIDYPRRTITIERGELPPADGQAILDIISDDEDPEVQVTIGSRTARALLDTGGMMSLAVPASYEADLSFTAPPEARGSVKLGALDGALRIGAFSFDAPQVIIGGEFPEPIVGARILAALRLTFDQRNARVRVEQPPARKRYGLSLPWRDDRLGPSDRIREVVPGGIAETAGLRAGDRILTLGGRAPADLNREDCLQALDRDELKITIERDGAQHEFLLKLE